MFDLILLILRGARLDGGLVDVAVAGGRIERVATGLVVAPPAYPAPMGTGRVQSTAEPAVEIAGELS